MTRKSKPSNHRCKCKEWKWRGNNKERRPVGDRRKKQDDILEEIDMAVSARG